MRKIEKAMVAAIKARESWQSGNTAVFVDKNTGGVTVCLHGHPIAWLYYKKNGREWSGYITFAGWSTRTTASRINAVLSGIGSPARVGFCKRVPELRGMDSPGNYPPMKVDGWYAIRSAE